MLDLDAIPYFPLKLTPDGTNWLVNHPITGVTSKLNSAAYWLAQLCDGQHTLGEIFAELAQAYQTTQARVMALSEPLLQPLTEDSILWWRRQRMQLWRLPPPYAVLWDLTKRCNLRCRHCVVNGGHSGHEELSLGECQRLINEMAAFGVRQLILSGGEPLLRRDFFQICEYATSQRLSLQIATNAALINQRTAQRLAVLGASAQVSLDGATPDIHDDFRQVAGSWERTIRGIRHLVTAAVPVTLAATVTTTNINQIPALYELANDLGVHTFRILPFVPYGRGAEALALEVSPPEMQAVTAYLRRRREEGDLLVAPMEFECTFAPTSLNHTESSSRIGCDGAVGYGTITSSGEVLPCNFFAGVEAENIKEHDFAWIWENSRFLNYFRSLTVADIHGTCQRCAWLPTCRGSCLAANFAHGDIFQSNCHCWLVVQSQETTSPVH